MSRAPPVNVLRSYLATQLRPLVLLTLAVVALTAPIAYLAMGTGNVREQAQSTARLIARSMALDLRDRPVLWRYDAAKLRRHLDAHLDPALAMRAIVTDHRGIQLEAEAPESDRTRPVWGHATIALEPDSLDVWVEASTEAVLRRTAWMLLGFVGLGLLLAGGLYFVPMRAMSRAQTELDELFAKLEGSRRELATLNTTLEAQVQARSAELSSALQQLEHKEQRLRTISRRATAAAEAERRALSRDLHDSAGQVLTAIRIHLQRLAVRPPDDATLAIAHQTMALADQAVEEIRRTVIRLAPAIVDDMGLRDALERLVEDWTERTGVHTVCAFDGLSGPDRLDTSHEVTCYRIVQEALTNVAKHAAASTVSVHVHVNAEEIELVVRDDGRGFAPQASPSGRGLTGMAERVALLGGDLEVDSGPDRGTRISARMPRDPAGPAVLPSGP
ncbi:MAG: sensor histidine kinase [Myxococcales bacterium FL481]|nr:MAG: sensor histidine kinase [Myxococcales bacterium FL481]